MYLLLAAALLPAIALMVYVYRKDRVESEPVGLVLRVFVLGAISGPIAAIVENVLFGVFEAILPAGILLIVIENFIGVAAVEEGCKYFCLNTVRKNPAFDYVFDAVIYAVAAALGFAALENVLYVFDGGMEVAITRAIFSVPGHMADGVVMGVFFGIARREQLHGNNAKARTYYWLAFLLPVIEHGFYDTALSLDSDLFALFAMGFDLAFIAIAFVLVHNTAKHDSPLRPNGPGVANGFQTMQQPMAQQPYQPQGFAQQQPYQQQPFQQQGFDQQQPSQQQGFGQQQPYQQQGFAQQQMYQPQGQQQVPYPQQTPSQPMNPQQNMYTNQGNQYQQTPFQQSGQQGTASDAPEPPARFAGKNGPSVHYSSDRSNK